MQPSLIRRACRDDWPRIHEIRSAVRENQLSDPNLVTAEDMAWFTDNPGIWVWEEEGHIGGFSASDTRDGTVWALFVDPAQEGRGIGRSLLRATLDTLREAGHLTATLSTGPGTRAEQFYRKAGWTVIGHSAKGELVFQSPL